MNEFLTWLLDAVQSVDPVIRTLLAGLAMMLETSVLVGSRDSRRHRRDRRGDGRSLAREGVLLGIAVVVGALLGESIGFWLGRFLGPRIQHSTPGTADRRAELGALGKLSARAEADRRSSSRGSCPSCIHSCR